MQDNPGAIPAAAQAAPQGDVTFKGRGQAHVIGHRLSLRVCPRCSQRNDRKTEAKGYCFWCAYEPSLADAKPAA